MVIPRAIGDRTRLTGRLALFLGLYALFYVFYECSQIFDSQFLAGPEANTGMWIKLTAKSALTCGFITKFV